ncbi:MAG: host attachment protein [Nitrospirae bacterium]|nr:host attachment protein [Nitrospirota bacterium]
MSTIIIAVDLGHFRAYKVRRDPLGRPDIELIESFDTLEGHGKLSEKLSDVAGRFVGGGGEGEVAKGYGEPHHLESEIARKIGKMIAMDINALIKHDDCEKWHLAAGKKLINEIIDKLEPEVKARMDKNIPADLTNLPKAEVVSRFE